ncbi:FAD-dependent oxidoreductase [Brevibacillus laterosporus]|uniref:FAD-dependent oxidoreductase n=1 Tax=Brevibacillus laterosporus TaxID=1465 RepID=A0AAP8U648_BRELA|nr:FAD-dependent oxidoreductase [Brevibacillus laterosporus]MCR8978360.1 FAD-dependent oxidoreductase [Brevibacillus laterosporus]MCZ0805516.1 FAD-dependent oxidoreductase [Brevibacillus laterosporus]MCZ0825838.1 FAD-dependent oxidoreductase [Brevibacillus laterosporus]MCZ0850122.1 FAD-dependent oxidoreductase [Brevibacillus laterosporus]MED1662584.1 FAD-dependent oxidoreductase [Brevibacillus laterosporus]
MKIAVIGCTHAGTAAIVTAAKLYPDARITVYERNDNISFLSCGIALYVGGVVKDPQGLFYSSPEKLAELGVVTNMRHDVISIDTDQKTLVVRNLNTNEEIIDSFDKLIVTTGSWPIMPNLDGIELDNIVLSKNFNHSNTIIEKAKTAKNVVVIGAGYIGIELVEAFEMNGKQVTLIDSADRILNRYLDEEFTQVTEKELQDHGVTLALGQTVTRFEGVDGKVAKVITTKGEYQADLVILCIGFSPNTSLLKGQVDMLGNGAIIVNEYMQTSKPDVYAAGDSCAIRYNPTGQHAYIPLATNAVRMGTLVAKNLVTPTMAYMGTQGTSGIKIYDYNIASTGLTEGAALDLAMNVKTVTIEDSYRPEFMPEHEKVLLKVVFEETSRRIVGAQIMSKADLTQAMNTLSVCIQNHMTIDQLAFVDFFFQPHYNKPWNFLNQAGLQAM